jgi:acylglycerol lipase
MYPHWLVQQILIGVAKVLPKTKLVPRKEEVKENFCRDMRKRELVSVDPNKYSLQLQI